MRFRYDKFNYSKPDLGNDEDDLVMVAYDKDESGGLRIVNDPHEIANIEKEEIERNRQVSYCEL